MATLKTRTRRAISDPTTKTARPAEATAAAGFVTERSRGALTSAWIGASATRASATRAPTTEEQQEEERGPHACSRPHARSKAGALLAAHLTPMCMCLMGMGMGTRAPRGGMMIMTMGGL